MNLPLGGKKWWWFEISCFPYLISSLAYKNHRFYRLRRRLCDLDIFLLLRWNEAQKLAHILCLHKLFFWLWLKMLRVFRSLELLHHAIEKLLSNFCFLLTVVSGLWLFNCTVRWKNTKLFFLFFREDIKFLAELDCGTLRVGFCCKTIKVELLFRLTFHWFVLASV